MFFIEREIDGTEFTIRNAVTFKNLMTELKTDGRVRRSQLGVTIQPVTSEMAESLGIKQTAGAIVSSVESGSAADRAGIKRGALYGKSDATGSSPLELPVHPTQILATIYHALGIDPHLELMTPTGRPVQLFREGRVIEKLLA